MKLRSAEGCKMDDLQFKYNILEAKLAAKQAELDEAKNKLTRATSLDSQIERYKLASQDFQVKLSAAENQIKQLQKTQLTEHQKSQIKRCEWLEEKVRAFQTSDPQLKIDSLLEQLKYSQNDHADTLRQLFAEQAASEKMREKIRSLKYQVSSPYNRQIRYQWRSVSFAVGIVLILSLIINIWLVA